MRVDTAADRLTALLQRTRNADGGWPYLAGRRSRLEPTCWAMLALRDGTPAALLAAWRSDGLLIETGVDRPNLAFNALAAVTLASRARHDENPAAVIVRTLLTVKGVQAGPHPALRQDAALQGWPWIAGTFSWAEPTAWCTFAAKKLARTEPAARARIEEAERLLRDRACAGGGWNYGNARVYGSDLHAHVPPTAVGVLALQDRRDEAVVRAAIEFLQRQAPVEGSTLSLALASIALAAVGVASQELVAGLLQRLATAEEFGNLSTAALMLYVLNLQNRGAPPVEFML